MTNNMIHMETGYKSLAEISKMIEVLPKVGGGGETSKHLYRISNKLNGLNQ